MAPRYDAQVTALGGRDGAALSSDGRLRVEMTDQPRRKGADPSGISPEHLFAAGFETSFLAAIYMAAAACRKTLAADSNEIGRAHVRTPVTNAHLVSRLLLEK